MWLQGNQIVTDNYVEASKYKIPKELNLYVIKDEAKKKRLMQNGAWQRLYVKYKWLYYLPPSVYGLNNTTCPYMGSSSISLHYPSGRLYLFQAEAIKNMLDYLKIEKWFFIRSGTWTGKTEMICWIVDALKVKTIIVTPTKLIAGQILEDLGQYSESIAMAEGKDIGKRISEYVQKDIFICTHMTFNDNFEALNGHFDLLVMDEWHHLPQRRIEQFALWKWRYIVGLSANFKRKTISAANFPKMYWWYFDTETESLPVEILRYVYKHEYSLEDSLAASEGYAPDSPEIRRKLMSNNPDRVAHLINIIHGLQTVKGIKKLIVFTDRKEYCYEIAQQLKERFGDQVIEMMSWDHNNLAVKAKLKEMDSYIIVAMEQVVREGMNIPALEAGVLFFSTSEENTINQLSGRVRRVYGEKKVGYLVDFVDYINIEWTKNKVLGYSERKKIYEHFGFPVLEFTDEIWISLPELKTTSDL